MNQESEQPSENMADNVASGGSVSVELLPGAEIGGCRVIKLLGHGGMGQVYLVENIQMHKKYALKVLPHDLTSDPTFVDRFRIEARVMADLNHPNIVRVHHIGEEHGRYYILMDYVENQNGESETLEDRLKRDGKFSETDTVELMRQLCDALDYAHNFRDGGIVHRDLKPSNILIDRDGRPVVADFGLAKVAGTEYLKSMIEHSMRLTMAGGLRYSPNVSIGDMKTMADGESSTRNTGTAGALIGTYEYMSPEQQDGQEATVRSDIYSLGMILYYCLTGVKPRGRWRLPSRFGLSAMWDQILEKAMDPFPEDRYDSAGVLCNDCLNINHEASMDNTLDEAAVPQDNTELEQQDRETEAGGSVEEPRDKLEAERWAAESALRNTLEKERKKTENMIDNEDVEGVVPRPLGFNWQCHLYFIVIGVFIIMAFSPAFFVIIGLYWRKKWAYYISQWSGLVVLCSSYFLALNLLYSLCFKRVTAVFGLVSLAVFILPGLLQYVVFYIGRSASVKSQFGDCRGWLFKRKNIISMQIVIFILAMLITVLVNINETF